MKFWLKVDENTNSSEDELKKQSLLPPPPSEYAQEAQDREIPEPEDIRPVLIKQPENVLVPRFNTYYDTTRTKDGWRFLADNSAQGSITTVVNSTVSVLVELLNNPVYRLDQWPGAVQLYLAIRTFGIVPSAVPTANGGMRVTFVDQFGNRLPLLSMLSQTAQNIVVRSILPTPITDVGNVTVGTLEVQLSNVATSDGTYLWNIGFSAVYLLPSRYGYEMLSSEQWSGGENKQ